jgi:hypothetical protein
VGSVARRAPARVRCIPLTGPRHLSCPSAGYVNPAAACAAWIEGARGLRDGGMRVAAGSRPRRRRAASGRASGHQRPVTTVTDESPRPVTARRSAPGTPGPVPHRPAAGRGRPRLRAPDRGSSERRCHRPGWPMGAGVCVVWRWRRKQLDAARGPAPPPCGALAQLYGAGAGRSPAPQATGRDRRPAVRLHPSRHGPGTRRGHRRPVCALAGRARDSGWTRDRYGGDPIPGHMRL